MRKLTGVCHPRACIGNIAEDAAVERGYAIVMTLAGSEVNYRLARAVERPEWSPVLSAN